jgi:Zn-dependent protease with chaperone function
LTRIAASSYSVWPKMTSASATYRLYLAISMLGLLAVVLGLGVALGDVNLTASPGAIASACLSFVMPRVTFWSVAVLAMASLGVVVLGLGARSAGRQAVSSQRFVRSQIARGMLLANTEVLIVEDPQAAACTAGLLRPRIYLTSGAVAALEAGQLAAVVAHEAHHVARRDPLRLLLARVLADALFFMPVLPRLASQYAAQTELAADAAAVAACGGRRPLAAALLAFDQATPPSTVGIAPERVDHLLGTGSRFKLPLALLGAAIITAVALLAITLQLSTAPADQAETPLPTLVEQVCLILRALLPVLAGALAVSAITRRLRTQS